MFEWAQTHAASLWWLSSFSCLAFAATLIAVPILVVRIPADYFARDSRQEASWPGKHPVLRALRVAAKNAIGGCLIVVGIAMLVLPGQGFLTIAIGVMLLDFPGKQGLARWLVARPPVLRGINWLRARRGHPPLILSKYHPP